MSETANLKIWRGERPDDGPLGDATRCRSSAANRCSTGCAGSGSTATQSLAIRFSCINANACKECMMELDGKTVYACTARLEPREMTLGAAVRTSGWCAISSPRSRRRPNGSSLRSKDSK